MKNRERIIVRAREEETEKERKVEIFYSGKRIRQKGVAE